MAFQDKSDEESLLKTSLDQIESKRNILQDNEIITYDKISYLWKVKSRF